MDKNDQLRITICVFIVATTIALHTVGIGENWIGLVVLLIGTLLTGLYISSFFAFFFIIAKGYELRYKRQKKNFIDKHSYILYNLAISAYAIAAGIVAFAFTSQYLKTISADGSTWADIGNTALHIVVFLVVIFAINKKEVYKIIADIKKKPRA